MKKEQEKEEHKLIIGWSEEIFLDLPDTFPRPYDDNRAGKFTGKKGDDKDNNKIEWDGVF